MKGWGDGSLGAFHTTAMIMQLAYSGWCQRSYFLNDRKRPESTHKSMNRDKAGSKAYITMETQAGLQLLMSLTGSLLTGLRAFWLPPKQAHKNSGKLKGRAGIWVTLQRQELEVAFTEVREDDIGSKRP